MKVLSVLENNAWEVSVGFWPKWIDVGYSMREHGNKFTSTIYMRISFCKHVQLVVQDLDLVCVESELKLE